MSESQVTVLLPLTGWLPLIYRCDLCLRISNQPVGNDVIYVSIPKRVSDCDKMVCLSKLSLEMP